MVTFARNPQKNCNCFIPIWLPHYQVEEGKGVKELFGQDVPNIIISYTAEQHNILSYESVEWKIAHLGYTGTFYTNCLIIIC